MTAQHFAMYLCRGKGRKWHLRQFDSPETWRQQALAWGYVLAGQVLDLSHLTQAERDWLCDQDHHAREGDDSAGRELSAALAELPRLSFLGYDVDDQDRSPEAFRQCQEIADRVERVELQRGARLTRSLSSGPGFPGQHLEFGWCLPGQGHPDLPRVALRHASVVAREAGLVPAAGCNRHEGIPLFWTLPGQDRAKLDLSIMNRGPESHGSLMYILGAEKGEGKKKSLIEGTCLEPTPFSPAMIQAALAVRVEAPYRRSREPKHLPGDLRQRAQARDHATPRVQVKEDPDPWLWKKIDKPDFDIETRSERSDQWWRFMQWAKFNKKPGSHHDERLALCAMFMTSGILHKQDMVKLEKWWGDPADMDGAWESTAKRVLQGGKVTGSQQVFRRFGVRQTFDLVMAAADLRDLPSDQAFRKVRPMRWATGLMQRGLMPPERYLADRTALRCKQRVERALHCAEVIEQRDCDLCDQTRHKRAMMCGVRELCLTCAASHAEAVLGCLRERWRNCNYTVHYAYCADRKGVKEHLRKIKDEVPESQRPLCVPFPMYAYEEWDERWGKGKRGGYMMLLVAEVGSSSEQWVQRMSTGGRAYVTTKERAIGLVYECLMRKTTVAIDLLERDLPEDFLVHQRCELSRRDKPLKSGTLWWPTTADLKTWKKHKALEIRRDKDPTPEELWDQYDCHCPTPGKCTYKTAREERLICESRFPLTLTQVLRKWRAQEPATCVTRGAFQPLRL